MKNYRLLIAILCALCASASAHGQTKELNEAQRALDAAGRELDKAGEELDAANAAYEKEMAEMEGTLNDQGVENVMIRLLYPAGKSPKVFTRGWVFGAQVLYMPKEKMEDDDAEPTDISDTIEWSGSGKFKPDKGKISRPIFSAPGPNKIVLSVKVDGKKVTKVFNVNAVLPSLFSHVGSTVRGECAHGCFDCPHLVEGIITTGSTNVFIGDKPAARVGDVGVHQRCCSTNTFKIVEGDPNVRINGRPAAKVGSKTQHCGGSGFTVN